MKNKAPTTLLFVVAAGCATTGAVKKDEAPLPVYLTGDVAPACAYKEIWRLNFTATDTSEGQNFEGVIKRDLSRRARDRGADAVIGASWEKLYTVAVAGSRSPASDKPQTANVTGTAIKFDSPDCKH